MMDYTRASKLFLKGFLGFLILTALLAIFSILTDSFGKTQAKILGTSSIISAASILAMACAAFLERKRIPWLGFSGIAAAVIAAVLSIAAIWIEIQDRDFMRVIMTFVVAAVGMAHAFLLVLPKLDSNQEWVQKASSTVIGTLCTLIIILIWGDFNSEWYARILGVLGILTGLVTLAVPLMMRLRKENHGTLRTLSLTEREDGLFTDSTGTVYRVTEES
ncbi:MAG: hypothetical protein O3C45_07185 [Bacteroidetes bacterium]|nr:hypothetical protein [Bacteroidota bacterium]